MSLLNEVMPYNVPKNLQLLKCSKCNKFLSIPPIYAHISDPNQVRCGRLECIPPQSQLSDSWCRQIFYEQLASNWEFPCSNPACTVQDLWQLIIKHETQCKHLPQKCLYPDCRWVGSMLSFFNHLITDHDTKQVALEGNEIKFCKNITQDSIDISIAKFDKSYVAFVHFIKTDKQVISYGLVNSSVANDFKYKIEISDNDRKTVVMTCDPLPIEEFQTNKPSCQIVIDWDQFVSIFDDGNDGFSFKYGFKYSLVSTNDDLPMDRNQMSLKFAQDVLKDVECPVCLRYFFNKVFFCKQGHSICESCAPKCTCCPTCRSNITQTRNYAVEGLVKSLKFPCSNREIGCTFSGTPDEFLKHKKVCPFGNISICFICGENSDSLVTHLSEMHTKNNVGVKLFADFTMFDGFLRLQPGQTNYWLTFNRTKLFSVFFNIDEQHLKFAIHNHSEELDNVLFDLELKSLSSPKRMCIKTFCSTENKSKADLWDNCITIPLELVRTFSSKDGHGQYIVFNVKLIN